MPIAPDGNSPSQIKSLILLAWKSRWTALEWDLNCRQIINSQQLSRKEVAKTLLEHAFIGSLPNQLIFSYFRHDVAAKLLTPCQAIESAVEFEQFHKTHCILALLDVLNSVKPGFSRLDLEAEKPMTIATCFARLLYWYMGILCECCSKLADLKSSPSHAALVEEVILRAHKILRSPFERSLSILALLSDRNLYSDLIARLRELETLFCHFSNTGLPSITPAIAEDFRSLISNLNSCVVCLELPRVSSQDSAPKYQTYGSIYGAITVEALLRPASDGKRLVKQLRFLRKLKGLSMSELYCEILRGAYLGLESSSKENTKWDAFFFVRLPVLIGILQQFRAGESEYSSNSNELVEAIEHLLHQAIQLINVCDTKWHCSTLELLMSEIRKQTGLLSEDIIQLLANKKHGLSLGVVRPPNRETQGITPVLLSMSFADSLLRTLDDESKKQEVTLDVLTKMLSSSNTLEIVCTAVAAGGRLPQFTSRFVRLNEITCLPGPENTRSGLTRANLFDISFLMLCYISQNYGMHLVMQQECLGSFFCEWAQEHLNGVSMVDEEVIGTFMDQLLAQYLGSEADPRNPQTRWPDMCSQAVILIKEILVAWSMDIIVEGEAVAYARTLRKYMMSLAVCAAVYLANRYQHWPEPQRSRAFILLEALGSPPLQEELNTADRKERLILMSMVISKIISEVSPKEGQLQPSTVIQSFGTAKSLEDIFMSCWSKTLAVGYVDQTSIATFDSLLSTAGPVWFVTEIFKACVNESHCLDNQRALEVAFSAVSLSPIPCCIALASKVIPELLSSKAEAWSIMEQLAGPAGEHAISLVISLLALGLYLECELDDPIRDLHGKRLLAAQTSEPAKKFFNTGSGRSSAFSEMNVRLAVLEMFDSMKKIIDQGKILPRTLLIGKLLVALVNSRMQLLIEIVPSSLVDSVLQQLPEMIPASSIVRLYDCHSADGRDKAATALCFQNSALCSRIQF